jgi:hypothetical protein
MKITPLAPNTSVGGVTSAPSDAKERAVAAMQGASTGNSQADRAKETIQMRTQSQIPQPEQIASSDTNEQTTSEPAQQVEETPQTEATVPLSPQFAALARHKRALQVKERELALREEALKTASPPQGEDVLAKLKANPLSVLQEAGVTYDQLTEAILSNQSGSNPDLNALKMELKALKEELKTELSQRDTQAEQQVLREIRREAENLTRSGEEFEAIREARAVPQVVELIHRTWKKTGEVLSTEEAAQLVENQLIEEALPFARIKKVQSKLTPIQEANQQIVVAPPRAGVKVMKTLTNRDSAYPTLDKRTRAIMAMQGTLKRE